MRLSLLTAIVASVTFSLVVASPLRVVVLTNNHPGLPAVENLRFGHALSNSHVAKISTHSQPPLIGLQRSSRRPCGKHIKDKVIQFSNAVRHAFGLPPIETKVRSGDNVHGGMVHILPFVGTPSNFIEAEEPIDSVKSSHIGIKSHHHYHGHHFHHWKGNTFTMRVHNALMSLGPWEGRAVAFVLGCGIGVLLRMIWVLTVVTFRAINGEREEEYTRVAVMEGYVNAENIVVPPPTYTASDEKETERGQGCLGLVVSVRVTWREFSNARKNTATLS